MNWSMDASDGSSDAELWLRVARGERDPFGVLFERHAGAIYNFCFRRTADWAAAEDLTAAVFLEAWRRRADVRMSHQSALPWLYGVAVNLLRNRARSIRRRNAGDPVESTQVIQPDFSEQVVDRMEDQRRMRAVLDALRMLPPYDQEVIALCVWQGLSYAQAAVALDVAVGTVRSRLSRARGRLRELTNETGHERIVHAVRDAKSGSDWR